MDPFLTYLALMVVSYVLQVALTPKQEPPPPSKMKDFDFPQTDEGTPQAVVFGDVWVTGWVVLSVGNFRVEDIKKDDKK